MITRWIPVLAMAAAAAGASAQDFPSHTVKIVVPWPPSGNVDITARTVAPAFSEALGQHVIVENLSGAGGRIGTAAAAKAGADGYTLLLGSSGTITSGPAVFKSISYDPLKDFVAIGPIQSVPIVLTAAPKTPVSSYKEFAALANAKPGQVSIASAGSGSSNHLAIELLMRQANLKLLHVPYKGSGPAIIDLLGSHAPSGVPRVAADKLYAALRRALSNETVRERYRSMGVDVMDLSRAEFTAYVRADFEKWRTIAREGNIVVE